MTRLQQSPVPDVLGGEDDAPLEIELQAPAATTPTAPNPAAPASALNSDKLPRHDSQEGTANSERDRYREELFHQTGLDFASKLYLIVDVGITKENVDYLFPGEDPVYFDRKIEDDGSDAEREKTEEEQNERHENNRFCKAGATRDKQFEIVDWEGINTDYRYPEKTKDHDFDKYRLYLVAVLANASRGAQDRIYGRACDACRMDMGSFKVCRQAYDGKGDVLFGGTCCNCVSRKSPYSCSCSLSEVVHKRATSTPRKAFRPEVQVRDKVWDKIDKMRFSEAMNDDYAEGEEAGEREHP
ncbi:hypothetical protein K490DRAFT_53562 [Saccharata proteae CBS 121410]|uniref:Uncharacterized protein n=1 Tax=Saccharata proteae CBS 121410 TaxID=1314787 RepID=A0A9P4HZU6_9PEZI|nr:hypothetical protein K490DRAFT_53562 [Saccharata proteae CBS 121410]